MKEGTILVESTTKTHLASASRSDEIRLHTLSLLTASLGLLIVDRFHPVTRDRDALLLALSRAAGLLILSFLVLMMIVGLVTFVVAVFSGQMSIPPNLAVVSFALVLTSPITQYIIFGIYIIHLVSKGKADSNAFVRWLEKLGRPISRHLMQTFLR